MNPLHYIFGIGKIVNDLNADSVRYGWFSGNRKFLEKLGIKVRTKLHKFPSKGAVLVYANHPTGLDPYLISSVLGRNDVYFLSDIYQTLKGKEIASHILPIYYWSVFDFIFKPILSWPGFFIMRIRKGLIRKNLARSQNRKSLDNAVKLLSKGNVVLIFPSGGEAFYRPWKSGIGKIIKESIKRGVNFKLYQIKILNLSEWQLLQHFIAGKRYYQREPVNLLGKAKELSPGLTNVDQYKIAQSLKRGV